MVESNTLAPASSSPSTPAATPTKKGLPIVPIILILLVLGVLGYFYWEGMRYKTTVSATGHFENQILGLSNQKFDQAKVEKEIAEDEKRFGIIYSKDRKKQIYFEGKLAALMFNQMSRPYETLKVAANTNQLLETNEILLATIQKNVVKKQMAFMILDVFLRSTKVVESTKNMELSLQNKFDENKGFDVYYESFKASAQTVSQEAQTVYDRSNKIKSISLKKLDTAINSKEPIGYSTILEKLGSEIGISFDDPEVAAEIINAINMVNENYRQKFKEAVEKGAPEEIYVQSLLLISADEIIQKIQ